MSPPTYCSARPEGSEDDPREAGTVSGLGEPTNIMNWLTDLTIEPTLIQIPPSPSLAQAHEDKPMFVHGGFYRNVRATRYEIGRRLKRAVDGYPIHPPGRSETSAGASKPLKAIYVTGHSLGGAMAVLMAILVHIDPDYAPLRSVLKGVYTFGQPWSAIALWPTHVRTSALPISSTGTCTAMTQHPTSHPRKPATSVTLGTNRFTAPTGGTPRTARRRTRWASRRYQSNSWPGSFLPSHGFPSATPSSTTARSTTYKRSRPRARRVSWVTTDLAWSHDPGIQPRCLPGSCPQPRLFRTPL